MSSDCEIPPTIAQLASDALRVQNEDAVFERVVGMSAAVTESERVTLFKCVRYAFLSSAMLDVVASAIDRVGGASDADDNENPAAQSPRVVARVRLPPPVVPFILRQLFVRSQRQSNPALLASPFGCWAFCVPPSGEGTPDEALTARQLDEFLAAAAMRPRHSYAFTLDVHGRSRAGCGAGLVFIWVDPSDPLGPNDVSPREEEGKGQEEKGWGKDAGGAMGRDMPSSDSSRAAPAGDDNNSVDAPRRGQRSGVTASASASTLANNSVSEQPAASTSPGRAGASSVEDGMTVASAPGAGGGRPSSPTPRRRRPHGLPVKYATTIASWGAAYGQTPVVLNGAQCALAVREASTHPEFHAAASIHVPRARDILLGGGKDSGQSPSRSPATSSLPPATGLDTLWDVYRHFAATGAWIQCVDVARLAVLWLAGGGTCYLDTDMQVGPHKLPRELVVPRAPAPAPAPASTPTSAPRPAPFLLLAEDADGVLQNNVLAVTAARHPFLTLLLQAVTAAGALEHHVVHATGPALFTALYYCFRNSLVRRGPEGEGTASSDGYVLRVSSFHSRLHSQLPSRPAGGGQRHGSGSGSGHRHGLASPRDSKSEPPFAALPQAGEGPAEEDADESAPGRVLQRAATYGDIIHVVPPSAFYPTHWRDRDDDDGDEGKAAPLPPLQPSANAQSAPHGDMALPQTAHQSAVTTTGETASSSASRGLPSSWSFSEAVSRISGEHGSLVHVEPALVARAAATVPVSVSVLPPPALVPSSPPLLVPGAPMRPGAFPISGPWSPRERPWGIHPSLPPATAGFGPFPDPRINPALGPAEIAAAASATVSAAFSPRGLLSATGGGGGGGGSGGGGGGAGHGSGGGSPAQARNAKGTTPNAIGAGAGGVDSPPSAVIRFGSHGWDCTWGLGSDGYEAGAHGGKGYSAVAGYKAAGEGYKAGYSNTALNQQESSFAAESQELTPYTPLRASDPFAPSAKRPQAAPPRDIFGVSALAYRVIGRMHDAGFLPALPPAWALALWRPPAA
jgi:hypothetical protein